MLHVSASPHIRDRVTTRSVMLHVIIALVPVIVASFFIFGLAGPMLFVISAAASVGFEALSRVIMKREQTAGDLSALVTGLLLAASLPANTPLWVLITGNFVAIVVVKQMFGGLGDNFANPAVTARIVLFVSFTNQVATFSVAEKLPGIDLVTQATPLSGAAAPSFLDLFLGNHAGCIGETSIAALLVGGIFLLVTGIIDIWAPLTFIGTTVLFTWATGADPLLHLMSGALILAAFFMVTDYVTTPTTLVGKIIFGVGAGLLTGLMRIYSPMPEGVSFAILFMNILTPHIERWTAPTALGGVKHAKK
ncbi:MAG: RnfABCDGE type electron transport complex subunit D [Clostridiaceae bacterium]|nr:RnfABCDGE type electron transport complex subunit D [Clostridiaceae bacterium]